MEKLTINDLPEDVLERMRRAIREDSQMIALKNKHSQYIINRQYAKAVLLKEKMQKIEDRVIREYLDSYEGETDNMQSLMSDMSPEDREYINTCTNAIILICDMIETFTMDFNQVLKKYHPDYRLEMYDKIMQLCKELAKFGRVAYDSLEEGASLTMQNTLRRFNMAEVNRRFQLLDCEPMSELGERMDKHKSPDFYVIDSFQYTQMSYKEYIKFKEAHRNKLLIFISHADGRNPDGRSAKKVMYDASLKIYVEGFRAFSKGRFFGSVGHFTIWDEGAVRYWGDNI